MRDFFNVGAVVLFAMLFAASQLGDLYAPHGAKFTQTSMINLSPSLADYAKTLGDGTALDAARDRSEGLQEILIDAGRG